MLIEKKLLNKWQALRSPSDTKEMAKQMGDNGYPALFVRAFRYGRCRDDVFQIMAAFYEEKGKLVKEYL